MSKTKKKKAESLRYVVEDGDGVYHKCATKEEALMSYQCLAPQGGVCTIFALVPVPVEMSIRAPRRRKV